MMGLVFCETKDSTRGTLDDLFDDFDNALTKRELQEQLEELHRQKVKYERDNKTFMSEERKRALSE